jgi:HK97 family phage prohead protease
MRLQIKGYLEKSEGELVGIASTEHTDRHGEVIKQEGWDLKNFKKNPVLMLSHNYQELPIGKVTNIKVENKKLTFKAVFSEATQTAKEAYQLVQEGILKAFSVGFIPRQWDEKDQNTITEAELLEISLVSIPANPHATVVAKSLSTIKDNELAKDILKRWLIEEKIKNSASEVIEENDQENGEEGAEVAAKELDLKLIQKATGYLQQLCREIKEKGGAKK